MGKAKLKENTELYMDVQTGELILKNPEPDKECEMYKSTYSEKVAYYCEKKGEWGEITCALYNGKLPKLEESMCFPYCLIIGL